MTAHTIRIWLRSPLQMRVSKHSGINRLHQHSFHTACMKAGQLAGPAGCPPQVRRIEGSVHPALDASRALWVSAIRFTCFRKLCRGRLTVLFVCWGGRVDADMDYTIRGTADRSLPFVWKGLGCSSPAATRRISDRRQSAYWATVTGIEQQPVAATDRIWITNNTNTGTDLRPNWSDASQRLARINSYQSWIGLYDQIVTISNCSPQI